MINQYEELIIKAGNFYKKWVGKVRENDLENFIEEVYKIDNFRFTNSFEWFEPITNKYTQKLIFNNPDPDKGLLLFFVCCWLDMQMKYKIVWSNFLIKAADWIEDSEKFERPRGNFLHTASNIDKTLIVAKENESISNWFIKTVLKIIKENDKAKGNLYRFVGHVMTDLLEPSKNLNNKISRLIYGYPDLIGEYKRVWMLLMFLRRDKKIIKDLLTKALIDKKNGAIALEYWYNSNFFRENESELPVDLRIKDAWPKLWGFSEQNEKTIGYNAHQIAEKYKIPSSIFDVIFFGVGN